MNDSTKETLGTIERLLAANLVSTKAAIKLAYQLGKFDGQLEMARGQVEKETTA